MILPFLKNFHSISDHSLLLVFSQSFASLFDHTSVSGYFWLKCDFSLLRALQKQSDVIIRMPDHGLLSALLKGYVCNFTCSSVFTAVFARSKMAKVGFQL
jgi:hypothetical protein